LVLLLLLLLSVLLLLLSVLLLSRPVNPTSSSVQLTVHCTFVTSLLAPWLGAGVHAEI
jgi:hypothetical protein